MFFIGDIVRIVKKSSNGPNKWSPNMDRTIGLTGWIDSLDYSDHPPEERMANIYFLDIPGESRNHYIYDLVALELESDPDRIQMIHKARNPNLRAIG